jgi:UV DNA damage endonuclease
VSTWPRNISPIVHYSSSKKKYEDETALSTAHADFIHEPINRYGHAVDIMLEAKAKEQAVQQYKERFALYPKSL